MYRVQYIVYRRIGVTGQRFLHVCAGLGRAFLSQNSLMLHDSVQMDRLSVL